MSTNTSITGTFYRTKWRATDDSDRIIGSLEDGVNILGKAEEGALVPGVTYEFFGKWGEEHPDHGKQFKFSLFSVREPHSRNGVVAYLAKYAPGVGPAVASRLFDAFGSDAVKVLRTQPEGCVAIPTIGRFLTIEKAREAAEALRSMAALEDTKIELTNLFHGRGFPGVLIEECVRKWRVLAPAVVRRDPFVLLVNEMPGCGFDRCNRLYQDLGLPLDRLKRQVICIWHALHSDSRGHTWLEAAACSDSLRRSIGTIPPSDGNDGKRRKAGVRVKQAILLGCRSGWLARKRDSEGKLYLAEGSRAAAEKNVAACLRKLSEWRPEEQQQGAA